MSSTNYNNKTLNCFDCILLRAAFNKNHDKNNKTKKLI